MANVDKEPRVIISEDGSVVYPFANKPGFVNVDLIRRIIKDPDGAAFLLRQKIGFKGIEGEVSLLTSGDLLTTAAKYTPAGDVETRIIRTGRQTRVTQVPLEMLVEFRLTSVEQIDLILATQLQAQFYDRYFGKSTYSFWFDGQPENRREEYLHFLASGYIDHIGHPDKPIRSTAQGHGPVHLPYSIAVARTIGLSIKPTVDVGKA